MKRTTLRPLRTRRVAAPLPSPAATTAVRPPLKSGTHKTLASLGALWLAFATSAAHGAAPAGTRPASPDRDALLARGQYLVDQVGMCADCHSPRNEKGEFDRARWLLGAPLAFQPTVPMPWSPAAPPIAGLPSMTESQAVAFLQTGKRPDGSTPRPPMPEYRFNAADATAVAAYLKSLAR